jgi:hypothetical protein
MRGEVGENADTGIPVDCPTCGAPLVYVRTEDETHTTAAPHTSRWIVPTHGRVP